MYDLMCAVYYVVNKLLNSKYSHFTLYWTALFKGAGLYAILLDSRSLIVFPVCTIGKLIVYCPCLIGMCQ